MSLPPSEELEQVARALQQARSVLVITGAGISADSGLPTYRGIGGLYEEDLTEDALPIEVALSGEMMRRRPEITWKYIAQIEAACRGAQPNAAHAALAALERQLPELWVLTQNIDGFHRAAGSEKLITMHGDVHRLECTGCTWSDTVPDFTALRIPPRCPDCAALIRPAVVLFGESLPGDELEKLYDILARQPEVVLSVGTTSVFPYIAAPVLEARARGSLTVEINPGYSEVSDSVDYRWRCGAAQALPALREALLRHRSATLRA